MKNKEAFKNWYCEFLGLDPKTTKASDLTYIERDKEIWEACESYYESRLCEDCTHWRASASPKYGRCLRNTEMTDGFRCDFCCRFWEAQEEGGKNG